MKEQYAIQPLQGEDKVFEILLYTSSRTRFGRSSQNEFRLLPSPLRSLTRYAATVAKASAMGVGGSNPTGWRPGNLLGGSLSGKTLVCHPPRGACGGWV